MIDSGDLRDNVFFLDEHTSQNPHGPQMTGAAVYSWTGNIEDHTGQIVSQISAFLIPNGANLVAPGTYNFSYNMLLPNAAGHMSFWITTPLFTGGTPNLLLNHNTMMVDDIGLNGTALFTGHSGYVAPPGTVTMEDNIFFNPIKSNLAYKLRLNIGAVDSNVCYVTTCDYNVGYNMLTDGGGYPGGGNGYADYFSGQRTSLRTT